MCNLISRRGVVVCGGIAALMIGLLFNSGILLQATAAVVPRPPAGATPPPAPTPLPGARSRPSVTPPGSGQPAYLVPGPSFAGKVLHWTQTNYTFDPNSPDATNGWPISGEMWLQFGDDGQFNRFRGYYTRADGTFLQEIVQTRDTTTVIFGIGYPASSPAGCTGSGPSSPQAHALPAFAAGAPTLASLGFTPSDGLTQPLPATTPLPGIRPLTTYQAGPVIRGWERREVSDSGTTLARRLEIDAQGRVVAAVGRVTDANGVVISESRQMYGGLDIYTSTSVPASFFALSQQTQEVCRG